MFFRPYLGPYKAVFSETLSESRSRRGASFGTGPGPLRGGESLENRREPAEIGGGGFLFATRHRRSAMAAARAKARLRPGGPQAYVGEIPHAHCRFPKKAAYEAFMAKNPSLEDFEVEGHAIPKGRMLLLSLMGAGWDPRVYPDPDRLRKIVARERRRIAAIAASPELDATAARKRLEAHDRVSRGITRLGLSAADLQEMVDVDGCFPDAGVYSAAINACASTAKYSQALVGERTFLNLVSLPPFHRPIFTTPYSGFDIQKN